MPDRHLGTFNLGVDFAVDHVVLRVNGEVDALTAPALGAMLRILVERNAAETVLDLAELSFMDASGLGVIADISARLNSTGRTLTLRSSPPMTLRILDITHMNEIVRFEVSTQTGAVLGPEESTTKVASSVVRAPSGQKRAVGQIRSPHDNSVIDAALRLITVLASATVDGADGVSVTLEHQGRMTTVASSNETVLRMDDHQYETGEGPCLAAASQGHWYHIESLAEETRWPAFVPLAMKEGIASILSTPIMNAERSIGALNIYSNVERVFGQPQQDLAALLASQASGILVDTNAGVTDEQADKRIADALVSREVIAQAQGILMSRQHLTADRAAASLYNAARTANETVRGHAASMVASAHSDSDVGG